MYGEEQKGGEIVAKMTPKQQRFCDEYLIDLNATQAAIRAGYSSKYANTNASKLLQITTIKEFIKKRMDEKDKKLIADQDEVLQYLTSVMRGESRASVVVVESAGNFVTTAREMEKAPDEKEKLKAAELLGRRYAIFTDRYEAEVSPVVIKDDVEK